MSEDVKTVEDIDLKIDQIFSDLCRPHTEDEAEDFKKSIESVGRIVDPICYWVEQGILIDGHNRMAYYESLPDGSEFPPPEIVGLSFESREKAVTWAKLKQAGRRNLDSTARKILIGEVYNAEKNKPGRPKKDEEKKTEQETAKDLASKTGESKSTVRRAGKLAESVKKIESVNAKFAADIRNGSVAVSEKTVKDIAKLKPSQIGSAIGNIRNDREWNDGLIEPEKPAKKETPEYLKRIEQCDRLHGDMASAFYAVCNEIHDIDRSEFEALSREISIIIKREKVRLRKLATVTD